MVMFLEFAQWQDHCCLCWHQSLTSCRCSWASGSQLYPSPRPSGDQSSPSMTTWMSLLLLYTSNWTRPSQCFALGKKNILMSFAPRCFKYCSCWYDMTAVFMSDNSADSSYCPESHELEFEQQYSCSSLRDKAAVFDFKTKSDPSSQFCPTLVIPNHWKAKGDNNVFTSYQYLYCISLKYSYLYSLIHPGTSNLYHF